MIPAKHRVHSAETTRHVVAPNVAHLAHRTSSYVEPPPPDAAVINTMRSFLSLALAFSAAMLGGNPPTVGQGVDQLR